MVDPLMGTVILLFLIGILVFVWGYDGQKEGFWSGGSRLGRYYNYYRYPWNRKFFRFNRFGAWNIPMRSTRNMSYDIRGDPLPIIKKNVGPWLNSELRHIHNKIEWY